MTAIRAYDTFSVCASGPRAIFAAKSTGTTAPKTTIQRCLIAPPRQVADFGKHRKTGALAFSAKGRTISAKTRCRLAKRLAALHSGPVWPTERAVCDGRAQLPMGES